MDIRSPRNINNIEFQEHTISKKARKRKSKENLFIDLIKVLLKDITREERTLYWKIYLPLETNESNMWTFYYS